MLLFKLVKCTNSLIKKAFGKFYARPVVTHTIGIAELAEHMASHNTPFSAGTIRGILTDMVVCVRELVMQNVAVKIENLAIFSIGIRPKKGADSEEEFSVANHIDGVRLRARATGKFSNNQLDLEATLKNVKELTKKKGKTSDTGSYTGSDTGSDTGSNTGNQGAGSDTGNQGAGSDTGNQGSGNTDSGQMGL